MGRERTGNRKHFFIYITCTVVVYSVFSSCTGIPVSIMEEFNFRKADSLMNDGQYAAALAENMRVLSEGPAILNDQALYRIALIYTHNENNLRDVYIAREYFTKILNDYPASPLRTRVTLWIQLIDRLERSQKEISDLKNENTNLGNENSNLGGDNTNLASENDDLKIKIEEKEKKINLLENKIAELETQIENLKQIDLGLEKKKSKGVP